METGIATNAGGYPPGPFGQGPTQVQRRNVRTVLAKPGVKCSPDLPRGLRRVSESAPISHRRVGRHRRCSRPTCGRDSIYDKLPEPVNQFYWREPPVNQYLVKAIYHGVWQPWN
jgi:hypothetical protein